MKAAGPAELYEVIRWVRPAHRVLHRAVDLALEGSGITVGMRAVLERVVDGPRTVPEIARSLDIKRQFVQRACNALLALDLVERRDNPAHKRSALIVATAEGQAAFSRIRAREDAPLAALGGQLSAADVRAAARVLSALTAHFSTENAAQADVERAPGATGVDWPAPPPRRRGGRE